MATEAAPAVAQEATTAPAPVQATEAAPVNDDPDGLKAAVAEHAADLADVFRKPGQSAENKPADGTAIEVDKPTDAATVPAQKGEVKPTDGEKPPEAKAEPEKPAEDSVAAQMAKYVRQHEKAIKREREALAATEKIAKERETLVAERAEAQKARNLVGELVQLVTTSPVDAIERLLGTDALASEESTLVSDLLARIASRRQGAPVVSEEDRIAAAARAAVERDRAEREQSEKANAAKRDAEKSTKSQQNREAFFTGLSEQFQENADKYPFLQVEPVATREVDQWMQERFNSTGKIPTGDEILGHFEAEREASAMARIGILEKRGKLPARTQAVAPVGNPSAATATGVDVRGQIARPQRQSLSLEEQREEIARQLDQKYRH
jgi:hypothetical protein